ncbi:hypothetical protein GIB67_008273 [Kingdonia uniflora]|uniref:Uncharacterized protein n=1 Tax=Kingdonia uniflora TaxID=39325 RepID=A0A7J7N4Z5_9MAGN|nr:hypothetical protein GIB67_008273 [Kingdonia uniflora]
MKCESVACIWSGDPPLHQVTATAVFKEPPTLFTGGSDGSIIRWSLSSNQSKQEIWPVAMLCGHTATIVDLGICFPTSGEAHGDNEDSGDYEKEKGYWGDVVVNSTSAGALISACSDGVLCIWNRDNGHCRWRQKLPPWVGTPVSVYTLPSSPRFVCVMCHSVDADASVDRELLQYKKASKCAVVIIDSYSLNIVRTVFHGNLSVGPVKFTALITPKPSLVICDALGNLQSITIPEESDPDGESRTNLYTNSSHSSNSILEDGLGHVVSIASCRELLVLIYKTHCIFKSVVSGIVIGDISVIDSPLCDDIGPYQSHLVGGAFLVSNTDDPPEGFVEMFAIWSNRGAAIVYKILVSDNVFIFEPHCEVHGVSYPSDAKMSIQFSQLNSYLLRIESIGFILDGSLLWKPYISILLVSQECEKLGEGGFLGDCIEILRSNVPSRSTDVESNVNFPQTFPTKPDNENELFGREKRIVSSSLVLFQNSYAPYAIVYGFYNGEIELVHFETCFQDLDCVDGSPCHEGESHVSKQSFLGHTSSILCLAAHRVVGTSNGRSFSRVIVSGSMDCTIRIWDLDTSHLITVMRHHVAPVRQIILPPLITDRPWNDCFLSVGDDYCVALISLDTLRVERMFPGHPNYPTVVVWDAGRGYVACLCKNHLGLSDGVDVLYLWDVKTGVRERVLRGTASHSMFDHFCRGININSITGNVLGGITSASSLLLPISDDVNIPKSNVTNLEKGVTALDTAQRKVLNLTESYISPSLQTLRNENHPVKCSCPFPGIATLRFNLSYLMFPCQFHKHLEENASKEEKADMPNTSSSQITTPKNGSDLKETTTQTTKEHEWVRSLEGCLIQFSLSILHLWGVDRELDRLLVSEMNIKKPENFTVVSALQGDKGSATLTFPGRHATLELWRSSSEFCAMRSLTIVSLAQRMISLSLSSSSASSALAAFYTRKFAEEVPEIKPPSLQLLVSFWQDESEHVRMSARSIFHCAASRAIPHPLRIHKINQRESEPQDLSTDDTSVKITLESNRDTGDVHTEDLNILAWLDSFEMQDWISCIGGTSQDAKASNIIVAAALAVWYPSLVKPNLATVVVHPLMKLVMAMNEKYSSTAAELLAEGMESIWKGCIGHEIPRLIEDIFFQIECVSVKNPSVIVPIRETLIEVLLPSLAMADIPGFLHVIQNQIWSTAFDSPVHLVSLRTVIRVVRGSPKPLAQYLDKVVNFILQAMDHSNTVMRKACLPSSMAALKEVIRVFPMVSLNEASTRLAVGDAIGDIHGVTIRVYDMQSITKIKVLDASGPPGFPSLVGSASEMMITAAITALSFSPDGEGLVAFSEHGLMIRWWSLGSAWWEKLSRNLVPVQCTKLIFVPPWEGFSSNSSRSSIMASITGSDRPASSQDKSKGSIVADNLRLLIYNLDLSYHLEWIDERKVMLSHHGQELGSFQL